jgi:hypothetical protein
MAGRKVRNFKPGDLVTRDSQLDPIAPEANRANGASRVLQPEESALCLGADGDLTSRIHDIHHARRIGPTVRRQVKAFLKQPTRRIGGPGERQDARYGIRQAQGGLHEEVRHQRMPCIRGQLKERAGAHDIAVLGPVDEDRLMQSMAGGIMTI